MFEKKALPYLKLMYFSINNIHTMHTNQIVASWHDPLIICLLIFNLAGENKVIHISILTFQNQDVYVHRYNTRIDR